MAGQRSDGTNSGSSLDLEEPLLLPPLQEVPPRPASVAGATAAKGGRCSEALRQRQARICRFVRNFVQDWWEVTRSDAYLSSSWSRRALCGPALTCLCLVNLVADLSNGACALFVVLDAVAAVALFAVSSLVPKKSSMLDVMIVAVPGSLTTVQVVLATRGRGWWEAGVPQAGLLSDFPVMPWVFCLVSSLAGVRAVAALPWSLCYVAVGIFVQYLPAMRLVGLVLFAWSVIVLVEKHCADAAMAQASNEMILEQGSCGHCSIDRASGLIFEASRGLEGFFGEASLEMRRLTDLVEACDREPVEKLLARTASPKAIMVTCCMPALDGTAECKVLPFYQTGRVLKVCFQLVGELRSGVGEMPSKMLGASAQDRAPLELEFTSLVCAETQVWTPFPDQAPPDLLDEAPPDLDSIPGLENALSLDTVFSSAFTECWNSAQRNPPETVDADAQTDPLGAPPA